MNAQIERSPARTRHYHRATTCARLIVLSVVIGSLSLVGVLTETYWLPDLLTATADWEFNLTNLARGALAISLLFLSLAALGAAFAILRGWRADLQELAETQSRLEQLELETAAARVKGGGLRK